MLPFECISSHLKAESTDSQRGESPRNKSQLMVSAR